jgi:hypothetical protein
MICGYRTRKKSAGGRHFDSGRQSNYRPRVSAVVAGHNAARLSVRVACVALLGATMRVHSASAAAPEAAPNVWDPSWRDGYPGLKCKQSETAFECGKRQARVFCQAVAASSTCSQSSSACRDAYLAGYRKYGWECPRPWRIASLPQLAIG